MELQANFIDIPGRGEFSSSVILDGNKLVSAIDVYTRDEELLEACFDLWLKFPDGSKLKLVQDFKLGLAVADVLDMPFAEDWEAGWEYGITVYNDKEAAGRVMYSFTEIVEVSG